MGFRVRKSFKVAPGVRMTVSPSGISTRVGVRGAGVSMSTSGRTTSSIGIPGSGIYFVSSSGSSRGSSGARNQRARAQVALDLTSHDYGSTPTKPSFASRWELKFWDALQSGADPVATAMKLEVDFPKAYDSLAYIELVARTPVQLDTERVGELLEYLVTSGYTADPYRDLGAHFVRASLGCDALNIPIGGALCAFVPQSRDALVWMALINRASRHADWRALLGSLPESPISTALLAWALVEEGRFAEVLRLTDTVTNDDDLSAFMLTQRAASLLALNEHGAAIETLRAALRYRSRADGVLMAARFVRAQAYVAQGKLSMARKDIDSIRAVEWDYPGIADLARLAASSN